MKTVDKSSFLLKDTHADIQQRCAAVPCNSNHLSKQRVSQQARSVTSIVCGMWNTDSTVSSVSILEPSCREIFHRVEFQAVG